MLFASIIVIIGEVGERMGGEIEVAEGKNVPSVYLNGFELGLSNADVSLNVLLAGSPSMSLYMSYTTAKTLSEALAQAVATLERVTERKIMTTQEVGQGLEKLQKEDQ